MISYDAKIVVIENDKVVGSFGLGFQNSEMASLDHLGRQLALITHELTYAHTTDLDELNEIYGSKDRKDYYDSMNDLAMRIVAEVKNILPLGHMYFCDKESKCTWKYVYDIKEDGSMNFSVMKGKTTVFDGDYYQYKDFMEKTYGWIFDWTPYKENY